MKKVVFYGARYMGMCVLTYLVAKGYNISVIPEDANILTVCSYFNLPIVTFDTMGDFDLFICCHGKKIIDKKYLVPEKMINIHPCLFKYKGHDPVKRYMSNRDSTASVESLYLIEEVDEGKVIERVFFDTPFVNSYGEFYNLALPYYFECIDRTLKKLNI